MAKDPRFNFYPDNWAGGTKRMNFMQKGAYMELLMLNFYCLTDGLPGFTEQEAVSALASAAAYTELWNFLKPKFKTEGEYFYSERLRKEFHKSKKSSEEQTTRANKRWKKNTASDPASDGVLPVNGNGNGNGIKKEKESFSKLEIFEALFSDELYVEQLSMTHKGKDLKQAFEECYTHHGNAPNPPVELWEWKQKLNTWLTIKRNERTDKKSNLKITPEGTLARHQRYGK